MTHSKVALGDGVEFVERWIQDPVFTAAAGARARRLEQRLDEGVA